MNETEKLDFRSWLLDSIREEYKQWANDREWFEMERNLWADVTIRAIRHIIDGGVLLLATDERRKWFSHYALSRFHYSGVQRPLVPIFGLNHILPPDFVIQKANVSNVLDMLDIAYKDYMFWYIGQTNNHIADLCRTQEYGLFWIMDEGIKGSFYLRANDEFLDYKLIEMLKLFEKAIYASILNRIILE